MTVEPTPFRHLEDRHGDLPEVQAYLGNPGQMSYNPVRYFMIGDAVDGTLGALWASLDGSEAAGFVIGPSVAAESYGLTWRLRIADLQGNHRDEWSALGFLNHWWEADMGAYLRDGLHEAEDVMALERLVAARGPWV